MRHDALHPEIPQLPPELVRSAPRDVELTPAGRADIAGIITLILAGLALSVMLMNKVNRDAEHLRQLAAHGVAASAEVTDTRRKDKRIEATYTYRAGDQAYGGKLRLRRGQTAEIGSTLPVVYLPSDP